MDEGPKFYMMVSGGRLTVEALERIRRFALAEMPHAATLTLEHVSIPDVYQGRPHELNAPEGPLCGCGAHSEHPSGWCGACTDGTYRAAWSSPSWAAASCSATSPVIGRCICGDSAQEHSADHDMAGTRVLRCRFRERDGSRFIMVRGTKFREVDDVSGRRYDARFAVR